MTITFRRGQYTLKHDVIALDTLALSLIRKLFRNLVRMASRTLIRNLLRTMAFADGLEGPPPYPQS